MLPAKNKANTEINLYKHDKTIQSFKTYATHYSLVNKGGKEGTFLRDQQKTKQIQKLTCISIIKQYIASKLIQHLIF